jgi:hypothetical protein
MGCPPVSKAVGGYVRRSERRYTPPVPDDSIPRCGHCKARLDIVTPWNQPHICKEVTFGTPCTLHPFAPFRKELPR